MGDPFSTKQLTVVSATNTKQPGTFEFHLRNEQFESLAISAQLYQPDRLTPLRPSTVQVHWSEFLVAKIDFAPRMSPEYQSYQYEPLGLPEVTQTGFRGWRQQRARQKVERENLLRARVPQLPLEQFISCLSSIWVYALMQTHNDPYYERASMRLKNLAEVFS